MAFPRKLLNDDEDVILDLHPHWWFLVGPAATALLTVVAALAVAAGVHGSARNPLLVVTLALVLASLLWLGARYARWVTTEFVVTTDRLIHRRGVLSKQGREIPLERINDISFHQSFFERLLGAGDLVIESAGEKGQEPFTDVRRPAAVQNEIYRQIERAKDRDAGRQAAPPQLSVLEQLERLDELRHRGVISEAEFQAKKTQLLERL